MNEYKQDTLFQKHVHSSSMEEAAAVNLQQLPAQLPRDQKKELGCQGAVEAVQISQLLHTFDASQQQQQQSTQRSNIPTIVQQPTAEVQAQSHFAGSHNQEHQEHDCVAPANCSVFQPAACVDATQLRGFSAPATQAPAVAPVSVQQSALHIVAANPPPSTVSAAAHSCPQQQQPQFHQPFHHHQQQQHQHQAQPQQLPATSAVQPAALSGGVLGGAIPSTRIGRTPDTQPAVFSNCAPGLQLPAAMAGASASSSSFSVKNAAAAAARAARQRKRKELAAAAAEKAAAAQRLQAGGAAYFGAGQAVSTSLSLPPFTTLPTSLPAVSAAGIASGLQGGVLHLGLAAGYSEGEEGGGAGGGMGWERGSSYGDVAGLDSLEGAFEEKAQKRMVRALCLLPSLQGAVCRGTTCRCNT